MDKFIKRAINEHKELVSRIERLEAFLPVVEKDAKISKKEYAAMVGQANAMNEYLDCLTARLAMHKIAIVSNGNGGYDYFEKVDTTDEQAPKEPKDADTGNTEK